MFDFVNQDVFYLCFGISYLFLALMIYVYIKQLHKVEQKMKDFEERIVYLEQMAPKIIHEILSEKAIPQNYYKTANRPVGRPKNKR